jgi:hypothetical protein
METVRIRDPGWKKVGSGIRDEHPGSATLPGCLSRIRIFRTGYVYRNAYYFLKVHLRQNCFQALGKIIGEVHPGSGFFFHPGARTGSLGQKVPYCIPDPEFPYTFPYWY